MTFNNNKLALSHVCLMLKILVPRVGVRKAARRATQKLPITPPHTHNIGSRSHRATCRGCLHLQVGQHNSPNRYDTKNCHASRCTHEKWSKNEQKQCTTGHRGPRARQKNTYECFLLPRLGFARYLYPLGLAQTIFKSAQDWGVCARRGQSSR